MDFGIQIEVVRMEFGVVQILVEADQKIQFQMETVQWGSLVVEGYNWVVADIQAVVDN